MAPGAERGPDVRRWAVPGGKGEGAMTVEGAIRQPQRISNRVRLTLFLVPMALAFSSAQVAKAIWPTLLTEAPWTLLAMSSNTTRMLLVQPLVPAHVFFGLALARPLLLVPLYYFFGRCYGDAALRWVGTQARPRLEGDLARRALLPSLLLRAGRVEPERPRRA